MIDSVTSFDAFYRQEHKRVRAALAVALGSMDEAHEAVDEAFARAFLDWKRVSAMDSPTGWIYCVAINVARRRARRRAMERAVLRRTVKREESPPPAGELWPLVASLPERQRQAIVLRFIGDLTEEQIAQVMAIRRGTVSRTLRDAQTALGFALQDDPSTREAL